MALNQVAFRPVCRLEELDDFWPTDLPALGGEPLAERFR
jgi:hypothetical protein